MEDPVISADGTTFERRAIEEHFRQRRLRDVIFMTNPVTDSVLMDTHLISNVALKRAIEHWWKQQQQPDPVYTNNTTNLQIPTLAVSSLYKKRPEMQKQYGVIIAIEPDQGAQYIGTRQVQVRPVDASRTDLPAEAEYAIWSLVQKHCFARSMSFDEDTGLPYTQLLFSIPSTAYKIGRLLQNKDKKAMEKRFQVNFLVERPLQEKEERMVILTAWNSNHPDRVHVALSEARNFILDKIV
jgi:hypothetical protein